MPISFNPKARVRVYLPSDQSEPDAKRPAFLMRRPTVGAVLEIDDIFRDEKSDKVDAIRRMVEILDDHLVETVNLPAGMRIADLLTAEECPALLTALIEASGPGGDDLKNLDWPRTSRPASSVSDAERQESASIRRPRMNRLKSNARSAVASAAEAAATGRSL